MLCHATPPTATSTIEPDRPPPRPEPLLGRACSVHGVGVGTDLDVLPGPDPAGWNGVERGLEGDRAVLADPTQVPVCVARDWFQLCRDRA